MLQEVTGQNARIVRWDVNMLYICFVHAKISYGISYSKHMLDCHGQMWYGLEHLGDAMS